MLGTTQHGSQQRARKANAARERGEQERRVSHATLGQKETSPHTYRVLVDDGISAHARKVGLPCAAVSWLHLKTTGNSMSRARKGWWDQHAVSWLWWRILVQQSMCRPFMGCDYSPRQVVCGLIGWEAGSVCVRGVCFRLGLVVVGDQAFASLLAKRHATSER